MIFKDQIVLVTGGTGSFGNFVVAKILEQKPKEIRIFSRDEKKQYDMKNHYRDRKEITFIVGDIRDKKRINEAMQEVDIVFQAAALKQVLSCESNPWEAIKTNIFGVENLIDSAINNKVSKVICLSTDKAVKPVNVMGMTKALQERLIINANNRPGNSCTQLSCVRYGNVMSSRGSAIPFFREQVKNNIEITITDVNMTRFLLTLGDAMDLVVFAASQMKGGEIFVKKSPATKIIDLAKAISEEAGKPFVFKEIGVYPGEKIHEILITEEELSRTKDLDQYFCIHPWWVDERYDQIKKEYCSKDILLGNTEIKRLLKKSDDEFEKLRYSYTTFTKM